LADVRRQLMLDIADFPERAIFLLEETEMEKGLLGCWYFGEAYAGVISFPHSKTAKRLRTSLQFNVEQPADQPQ
jgi:hypothetical protein